MGAPPHALKERSRRQCLSERPLRTWQRVCGAGGGAGEARPKKGGESFCGDLGATWLLSRPRSVGPRHRAFGPGSSLCQPWDRILWTPLVFTRKTAPGQFQSPQS